MKFNFWKMSLIPLAMAGLFLSQNTFAFDDLTTHPALTDEVIDFYNLFAEEKISSEDKETIILGAQDEDIPPRWINHFYDPVRNLGWTGRNTGVWPEMLVHYFSGTVLSSEYPVSSLVWLHNQELQSKYSRYKGNRTWERALAEYVSGNKKEAYYTLGYVLHLMEDASVPDHTRDDPHAHEMRYATGDYGSPLEEYAKYFSRDNLNIAGELKGKNFKPAEFDSVDKYLVSLAQYSNGHFFSKDTINDSLYTNPKIVREDDGFGYGLDKNGEEFKLVKITRRLIDNYKTEKIYSLLEEEGKEVLMPIYFSRLSREAVIYGAGVIDLFHKEAEAITKGEKPAPEIFKEAPSDPAKALILFYINPVLGIMAYGDQNFSATGEFFKIISTANAANEVVRKVIPTIANEIKELFTSKQPPELLLAGAVGATLSAGNVQHSMANISEGNELAENLGNNSALQNKISFAQNSLEEIKRQIDDLEKKQARMDEPPTPLPLSASDPVIIAEENKNAASTENRPKIFLVSLVYPGFGGGAPTPGSGQGGVSAPQAQMDQAQEEQASEDLNLAGEPESETEEENQEEGEGVIALLPPVLSAPQCEFSLALDGCLLATTTVNFVWQSGAGAEHYSISKNGEYATTTELSFTAAMPDFSDYNFSVSAIVINDGVATTSATSTQTVSIATIPIAINEVAWMGTSADHRDEWLELKNNTTHTLDLSQWAVESKDGAPYIALSGQMAPREYRVLQRRDNAIVINAPVETYGNGSAQWAMSNSGEELILYFASTTLDKTPAISGPPDGKAGGKWIAGENSASSKKSMERVNSKVSGDNAENWATWGASVDFIKNGSDADENQILGTPGECNSASYANINNGEEIESDITLAANGCYYISDGETVAASSTLTIEAGARINLSESDLVVDGILNARGEQGNPVVFDTFSREQTWNGIQIYGGAGTSTIDHVVIKNIGGIILDEEAAVEITNSEFIKNKTGVELYAGSSAIIENVNFASTTNEAIAAYDGSRATVASSTIINSINAGAINVYSSTLAVSSTTIGMVYNGDGIGAYDSDVSIASTTVSNVLSGDGIGLYDSDATLENVTVENVSGEGVAVYDSNVSGSAKVDGEVIIY